MSGYARRVTELLQERHGELSERVVMKPSGCLHFGGLQIVPQDWKPEDIVSAREVAMQKTVDGIVEYIKEHYVPNTVKITFAEEDAGLSFHDTNIPEDTLWADFPSTENRSSFVVSGSRSGVGFHIYAKIEGLLRNVENK